MTTDTTRFQSTLCTGPGGGGGGGGRRGGGRKRRKEGESVFNDTLGGSRAPAVKAHVPLIVMRCEICYYGLRAGDIRVWGMCSPMLRDALFSATSI
jgi:hypothetical protein